MSRRDSDRLDAGSRQASPTGPPNTTDPPADMEEHFFFALDIAVRNDGPRTSLIQSV